MKTIESKAEDKINKHIERVRKNISDIIAHLLIRKLNHDKSPFFMFFTDAFQSANISTRSIKVISLTPSL